MRVFAFRVQQPLGEFYISSLPASVLVGRVNNRPRTSDFDRSEEIQRMFSGERVQKIADFTGDPQAVFPTPIIIALESKIAPEKGVNMQGEDPNGRPSLTSFELPDEGMIGDVLDGQHRVLGLKQSLNNIKYFELPVVLMFDLSIDEKAFVFSIINSTQTPVSKSLIYDLFGLSDSRSPQKTCHYVAQSLNSDPKSPFYKRLKMLGRREPHHLQDVMLSQGSFATRLEELISKEPNEDARILKEGKQELKDDPRCPLRKYFKKGDDQSILKIVKNYFSAAAKTFEEEWEDPKGQFVIRKTVGYTALIIVFRHLLEDGFRSKDLRQEFFEDQFDFLKRNLNNNSLTSDNFPSSGAGAIKLAKALLSVNTLTYSVSEAPNIEDLRLEK